MSEPDNRGQGIIILGLAVRVPCPLPKRDHLLDHRRSACLESGANIRILRGAIDRRCCQGGDFFLDTYRTLRIAPPPEIRELFEGVRTFSLIQE